MATSNMDDVWKILGKYKIEICPLDSELICILCKNILIQPRVAFCGCRYCHDCYTKHLKEGGQYCLGETDSCRSVLICNQENVFNDERINCKIAKTSVKCPGRSCNFRTQLENMTDHMKTCDEKPQLLNIGRNKTGYSQMQEKIESIEKILNHVERNQEHSKINIEEINQSVKEIIEISKLEKTNQESALSSQKQLEEQIKNLTKKVDEKFDQFEKILKEKLARLDKLDLENTSLKILEPKLDQIQANQNCGEYLWCVENWKHKMKQAQDQTVSEIYSDPFYSHKNGYKMCLELNPVDDDNKPRTHLSLYLCIMKGEFDEILHWPFQDGVRLELLIPETDKVQVCKAVTYNEHQNHCAWRKPTKERNTGVGFQEFIELSKLSPNGTLCRNDKIWIRAKFLESSNLN